MAEDGIREGAEASILPPEAAAEALVEAAEEALVEAEPRGVGDAAIQLTYFLHGNGKEEVGGDRPRCRIPHHRGGRRVGG